MKAVAAMHVSHRALAQAWDFRPPATEAVVSKRQTRQNKRSAHDDGISDRIGVHHVLRHSVLCVAFKKGRRFVFCGDYEGEGLSGLCAHLCMPANKPP